MKQFIFILFLSLGSIALAQPTSGDIQMEKIDSSAMADPSPIQTTPSFEAGLTDAFKTGNATKLATYFGENVDLSLLGKANLYSGSQAEQILQHFFTSNLPIDFKIIHKGQSKTNQYIIGELETEGGKTYRVTINSKAEGTKSLINSLTITADT